MVVIAAYCAVVAWSLSVVLVDWWAAYWNGTWAENVAFGRNWQIYIADTLYLGAIAAEILNRKSYMRFLNSWVSWVDCEMGEVSGESEEEVGSDKKVVDLEKGTGGVIQVEKPVPMA